MQRVLLTGATGHIGHAVSVRLQALGHPYNAVVRKPTADISADSIEIADLRDETAVLRAFQHCKPDVVISCIASRTGVPADAWAVEYEANHSLLEAAKRSGVQHFILLSAICVQKPRLAFQFAKLKFEDELVRSGIDYTIVRPTAFHKSLVGQMDRLRAGKPYLLFGDGKLTRTKSISSADMAAYLVDCLAQPARLNQVLPIGGPGPELTPLEMGELMFATLGLPARFQHVPPQLMSTMARVLTPFGRLSNWCAEKAELGRIAHYYATESTLLWDERTQQFDAAATPEYGSETLGVYYQKVSESGVKVSEQLAEHKLF